VSKVETKRTVARGQEQTAVSESREKNKSSTEHQNRGYRGSDLFSYLLIYQWQRNITQQHGWNDLAFVDNVLGCFFFFGGGGLVNKEDWTQNYDSGRTSFIMISNINCTTKYPKTSNFEVFKNLNIYFSQQFYSPVHNYCIVLRREIAVS